MDPDTQTRAAIEEHWLASESGDTEAEHAMYAADAILDYPSQANDSGAARRFRRNVAGILPLGTSPSCGLPAAEICG